MSLHVQFRDSASVIAGIRVNAPLRVVERQNA